MTFLQRPIPVYVVALFPRRFLSLIITLLIYSFTSCSLAAIKRQWLILFVLFSLSSLTRCLCCCSATSKERIWCPVSSLSLRRDPFLFLFCYEPKTWTVLRNLNFTLEYVYDTRQYTGRHVRRPKHIASNLIPPPVSSINYLYKTKCEKSFRRCYKKPPGINLANLHA